MNPALRKTFLEQYAIVRHAEGRGSDDPAYYQALPFDDRSGRNRGQWRIRARSFDHFLRRILAPLEAESGRSLDVLDLGAGNGWMSWRLTQRGHRVIPVDIFIDDRDGLGAIRKYAHIGAVAADFNCLPFLANRFDVIIYNASLHYSSDYLRTLGESLRCLRPEGRIVILDSPLYGHREDGEKMRRERRSLFQHSYGFSSDALGSIEYLDRAMLGQLSRELGIRWELRRPWYGWKWALRPLMARFRGRRRPSRFLVITGGRP